MGLCPDQHSGDSPPADAALLTALVLPALCYSGVSSHSSHSPCPWLASPLRLNASSMTTQQSAAGKASESAQAASKWPAALLIFEAWQCHASAGPLGTPVAGVGTRQYCPQSLLQYGPLLCHCWHRYNSHTASSNYARGAHNSCLLSRVRYFWPLYWPLCSPA